jgi:hypothetical protein
MPRWLPYVVLTGTGVAGGLAIGSLVHDTHTATTERLTGTVIWSNAETRLIAFETDGQIRDPLSGDTFYHVTGQWQNTAGTMLGDGFPDCLAGSDGPVSSQHRTRRRPHRQWWPAEDEHRRLRALRRIRRVPPFPAAPANASVEEGGRTAQPLNQDRQVSAFGFPLRCVAGSTSARGWRAHAMSGVRR